MDDVAESFARHAVAQFRFEPSPAGDHELDRSTLVSESADRLDQVVLRLLRFEPPDGDDQRRRRVVHHLGPQRRATLGRDRRRVTDRIVEYVDRLVAEHGAAGIGGVSPNRDDAHGEVAEQEGLQPTVVPVGVAACARVVQGGHHGKPQ